MRMGPRGKTVLMMAALVLCHGNPAVAGDQSLAGLRGQLVDADTGAPVPHALVAVQWITERMQGSTRYLRCLHGDLAETTADGSFVIPAWTISPPLKDESIKNPQWTAYFPGYLTTTETIESTDARKYPIRRFPDGGRKNPEYYLRYLLASTQNLRFSGPQLNGCVRIDMTFGKLAPNTSARFQSALLAAGEPLPTSPYEHYLLTSLKATLGAISSGYYREAPPPNIDVRKIAPSDRVDHVSWDNGRAKVAHFVATGPGALPEPTRFAIFCSQGMDKDCDINARRADGNTLLMDSVVGDADYVQQLLKMGANPGIENQWTQQNALSVLLKRMYEFSQSGSPQYPSPGYVPPSWDSARKVLDLLVADPRTRITPSIRKELNDGGNWGLAKPQWKPYGWNIPVKGPVRDFFQYAYERIKSLPDSDESPGPSEEIRDKTPWK